MSQRAATQRGWSQALGAAVVLGLASLLPDPTTSGLLGSGTAWAGLPVLTGWLLRRPAHAAAAGVVAGLAAMVVHDAAGQILGAFGAGAWADDRWWFVLALVTGGPLGLLGASARRRCLRGLLARLAVPAGAVLEPLVVGAPTAPVALALVASGAVGAVVVLRRSGAVTQVTRPRA